MLTFSCKRTGKMPINMSDSRADSVLAELQSRYDATKENAEAATGWIEDMPMCAAFRANLKK